MNTSDLAATLHTAGVNPAAYVIQVIHDPGGNQDGILALTFEAGEWVLAAYERGERFTYLRTANEDEACREMYSMLTPVHPFAPVPTPDEEVDIARRGRELDFRLKAEIGAKQARERPSS